MLLVEPAHGQIVHLPFIAFVYGGPLRKKLEDAPTSMRDRFVNWSHETGHPVANLLKLPEYFPEWNQFNGYDDLVEFERDAGCLSRAILLFIESPGAFTELGAFCTDPVLAERLFVVLYSKYYRADSFITLGPLRVLMRAHGEDQAICAVDGDGLPDFENVLVDIANEVFAKTQRIPKQQVFHVEKVRDHFLFIADVVELFGALTLNEIMDLVGFYNLPLSKPRVIQMLNLLCLLNVVQKSEHLTRHFYVPAKGNREGFISYKLRDSQKRLDRVKFKITAMESMKHDSFRRQAYEKIHGYR